MALRIYADESVHVGIATGLIQRGVDAFSARQAGKLGLTDEEQLEYAIREQAVVFTHDADFLRLAYQYAQRGKDHWGIVYVPPQKLGVGQCIRRLVKYALAMEAEDMKNRVEFL